jgi:formylglycine-generating enzyme required for sulfatase activity
MKTTWMPRVGAIMTALLLSATLAQAQGTQLLVSNVQAQQRQFTATWDVTYDLETVGDIAATVNLSLSTDSGATYPNLCASVTGDVGAGVLPGTSKHIVWDAGVDFPSLSSAACRLRVTADDGQSEAPAGFVAIAAGTFMMGSPTTEAERNADETQHQVTLRHAFYVQTTEVTNRQYMELAQWAYDNGYVTATSASLRDNLDGSTEELLDLDSGHSEIFFDAGAFSCVHPDNPVMDVTWYGSAAYCDWLSLEQGLARAYAHDTWECNGGSSYTAAGYRLPTEAEWEYACRAGSTTEFANGVMTNASCYPSDPNLDAVGWFCGNAGGWTQPGAQKTPNAWGIYDMHGNLAEWCNDWYGAYGGIVTDPEGAWGGAGRVIRGGFWNSLALNCRSAVRNYTLPYYAYVDAGFRPVRSAD